MNAPLLVTGLPRTGTSWVGKMLEASGELVYVNEPLNPQHPPGHSPGVLNARVGHRWQYICDDNAEDWLPAFRDTIGLRYRFGAELRRNRGVYDLARLGKYGTAFTLGRLRRRRALLDDPFALLSTRWLVERLGCRAVVLVRDPVALVGSWQKLGWRVHFHELLEQPLLVRDLLSDALVAELRELIGSPDHVTLVATLWRLAYSIVDSYFKDLPGVRVQRYEDLATDPERGFARLYAHCGLTWSARAEATVRAATRGGGEQAGSHRWSLRYGLSKTAFRPMDSKAALGSYRQRLTEHEIAQVRIRTAATAARFYPDGVPSEALTAGPG
ncbi:MAG: sulfotransferase [Micromonosporaceae bacterium]